MEVDGDSDEEEVAVLPSGPRKKVRKLAGLKELRTVTCREMELTVKARDKTRGIAVPLEGPTLLKILKHLRERFCAGAVPGPDLAKNEQRKEAMSYREDEDAGRLRWLSGETTYQIMWQDADGKDHRRTKGLQGPRRDMNGKPLSAPAFKARRVQMLSKARAL